MNFCFSRLSHANCQIGLRNIKISICNNSKEDFTKYIKSLYNKLSQNEIESLLSKGEENVNIRSIVSDCPIKEVFIQQLTANNKLEDRWNIGMNQVSGVVSSFLAGVVDGHSGHDCAHLINKAALEYIAASYLDHEKLMHCFQDYKDIPHYTIVRNIRPGHWQPLSDSAKAHLQDSLFTYMHELLDDDDRIVNSNQSMKNALIRLDNDLCMPKSKEDISKWIQSKPILRASLSGAVALFLRCYWKDPNNKPVIHIANIGDCSGIIVKFDKEQQKHIGVPLAVAHNSENAKECERILKEHPNDSAQKIFRENRLLGELMCFRAFGDVRYKWPKEWLEILHKQLNIPTSKSFTPKPYTNPPYLTAEPEVFQYQLDSDVDKYIVLGTDGLWDVITPNEVADCVTNNSDVTNNPATRLLKTTLGHYGGIVSESSSSSSSSHGDGEMNLLEQHNLSMQLSLPHGVARYFRDDITIMILKL